MNELLDALRRGDPVAINKYAMLLLVTKDQKLNKAQANEFERFAPCLIQDWTSDIFKTTCYVGTIVYNNKVYGFG